MVEEVRAIFLCVGLAAPLLATGPFSLKLTDLSDEWFPAGAVIRVPNSPPVKEIWVRVERPAAHAITIDAVGLHLDGRSPNQKVTASGEDYVLKATTREPRGFLRSEQRHIGVFVAGKDNLTAEWTILPEDRGGIEAEVAGSNGETIRIDLEKPMGFVQLLGGQSRIRVKATLSGGSARLLHAAGISMTPKAGAGLVFDQEVPVPDGRDFAVWAEDVSGSCTKIVLRILPSPGQ